TSESRGILTNFTLLSSLFNVAKINASVLVDALSSLRFSFSSTPIIKIDTLSNLGSTYSFLNSDLSRSSSSYAPESALLAFKYKYPPYDKTAINKINKGIRTNLTLFRKYLFLTVLFRVDLELYSLGM